MSSRRVPELEASWRLSLTPELMAKIDELIEECVDRRLPEVVRKCLEEREKLSKKEILKLRKIPHEKAVALIKKYIDENRGCRTSEIILNLQLDPDIVLKAIRALREKGEIRSEEIV